MLIKMICENEEIYYFVKAVFQYSVFNPNIYPVGSLLDDDITLSSLEKVSMWTLSSD